MRGKKRILPLLMALLVLAGCGSAPEKSVSEDTAEEPEVQEVFTPYEAPAARYAQFHAEHAQGEDGLLVDLEHMNDGYISVCMTTDSVMKLQVLKDEDTYTYSLNSDGTVNVFPVQCGNGTYTVRVMQNVVDTRYTEVASYEQEVSIADEFAPYLYNSDYVNYNADSDCVALAKELAAHESDELGVVSAIYDYICAHITYDSALAASVPNGYMPVLDEVLASGTGICFDYASLAAAMLRSQGIPTKVIFGYVAPDDIYHAWNMFYTEESGWVTVDFQVDTDTWNRMDLTFAANGADDSFIGNGTNYTDVYFY